MKMKLTHLISDLIHAPMYRIYENEAGSIKYIIRECHIKDDIFKYQVVGSVSAIDITPAMRRKVLSELAENKLVFLYENLLFVNKEITFFYKFFRYLQIKNKSAKENCSFRSKTAVMIV